MRVKLYRGPSHGKSIVIPDDRREIVTMTSLKSKDYWAFLGDSNEPLPLPKKAVYRMKVVEFIDGHTLIHIPSVHPDGSVYFEFDG